MNLEYYREMMPKLDSWRTLFWQLKEANATGNIIELADFLSKVSQDLPPLLENLKKKEVEKENPLEKEVKGLRLQIEKLKVELEQLKAPKVATIPNLIFVGTPEEIAVVTARIGENQIIKARNHISRRQILFQFPLEKAKQEFPQFKDRFLEDIELSLDQPVLQEEKKSGVFVRVDDFTKTETPSFEESRLPAVVQIEQTNEQSN